MRRIYGLMLICVIGMAGCDAPVGAGINDEPTPFRSEANWLSATLPAGWAAAEGPADLSAGVLMHAPTGIVAFNSWGEAGFWAVAQSWKQGRGTQAEYGREQVLKQMPDAGVYLVLTESTYFAGSVITSPGYTEHTSQDVIDIWPEGDCREERVMTSFFKWGTAYELDLHCGTAAEDEVIALAMELIESLRFDAIPAGNVGWAVLEARALLPESITPSQFPGTGSHGRDRGDGIWESYITEYERIEDRRVRVTFVYHHGLEAGSMEPHSIYGQEDGKTILHLDRCLPESCHYWQYEVGADGTVTLIDEGGGEYP
jgi:hypothetical protein